MGRYCADCGDYKTNSQFSSNQLRKGDDARCRDCVGPVYSNQRYICSECYREFENQNQLQMHMQVHRPRNVKCPVCGDQRFKSGANAVQHVESGTCPGCLGKDNARRQIYEFANRQGAMRPYMNDVPLLENGVGGSRGVPDLPYCCRECSKSFRHLSQLLQHQDQKHGNPRLLTYY